MSTRTFLIEIPTVRREFIILSRAPRVGELISSRHMGFFRAEVTDELPAVVGPTREGPMETLQKTMWLIDRSAQWIAKRVREGRLRAYQQGSDVVFLVDELHLLLGEELPNDEDWCCRVEMIEHAPAGGDADAVIYTRALPAVAQDRRQLSLAL